MTLTGSGSWSRSDEKHPVRLWLWSRPHGHWWRRKRWCHSDGYTTGNQAERLVKAAEDLGYSAHIEFYPNDHLPDREGLL